MKKIYTSLILPFALYGQTLQVLVDNALENQLVESSIYNIESIKKEYESTKSNYLPKVTIGSSYTNTNEETASTADSSIVSYANINYIVYDGGAKNARYDSYESSIKSSTESLSSLKNSIALQVVNYYFNYQSLNAQKEAKQKEIETLNAQKKRLQSFLEAGTTTGDEVYKIISRVEIANVALHEIELNIQIILHNLRYLTSKDVTITNGSLIKDDLPNDESSRADIKALEFQMDSLLKSVRVVKSSNYPIVTLENSFNHYNMDYDNSAYDSNLDTQNIFKVNFSWKIFDFGSTSKAAQSVYSQYQGLKSHYDYEKNKANVDLQLSLKSYDIAKLKINSAKAGLNAANSTYETIEAKYQNGLVENVAYLEALSEKYDAISALKSAEFDLEIKKADIIYHSGKDIWEYIK
ncbi:MAG: TolC family protein [Campylobacterota bacterium]|nr:TolC family protein [Campylobacterota bacterium]